jgi:hypothetical protein
MTILYPSLSNGELRPYEAPFGRMMLAYGRAVAATIALVATRKKDEAEAVLFVAEAGTEQLPKRMRRLFRNRLNSGHFDQLSDALTRFKTLAAKRNELIHGDWWFNHLKDGQLTIRIVRSQSSKTSFLNKITNLFRPAKKNLVTIDHPSTLSACDLERWAQELNEIADILDHVEFV